MSKSYKIGDLAREFDVTLRTLRFYEDRGLIQPTRAGTTRLYSELDRKRLEIALFGKKIGLSLGEIRDVLALYDQDGDTVSTADRLREIYSEQLLSLEKQLVETGATITDLQQRIAEIDAKSKH